MESQAWNPVAPSHFLRSGDNIVAGFVEGQELALWRSKSGSVQAWENRCPHRGTRLTLGRIVDGRLSCAYHGWEFTADGGKCAAIPAQPRTPAPKQLCVRTFGVAEAAGMVWVRAEPTAASEAPEPEAAATGGFFCRSVGLRTTVAHLVIELRARGFEPAGAYAWRGRFAGKPATVLVNAAHHELTFAHVWLELEPDRPGLLAVLASLGLLRRAVEARMGIHP